MTFERNNASYLTVLLSPKAKSVFERKKKKRIVVKPIDSILHLESKMYRK